MTDPFQSRWPGVGIGGAVALDFANTLDWRLRERPVELLQTFSDLLRWAWSAGVLDLSDARALQAWSAARPRVAARALADAIEVREAIAVVFQARARGKRLPAPGLARLDAACREAWARRALVARGPKAAWEWQKDVPEPRRPAWAAALDAARILTSDDLARMRQCGDAQCGWLFLDTSRNRSRRWCTMKGCGNRNKARSFYRRSAGRKQQAKKR
jgi:predicted RNA-binding Zn ribbon-like protein